MANIKNIIFDLGNVIIDLDAGRTRQEMGRLMRHPDKMESTFDEIEKSIHVYETGDISDELFINQLIKHAHPNVYAQQVIRAWNAMLIDIPEERLFFLSELKNKGYRVFLLSNTNGIHLDWVNNYMKKNYNAPSLDSWFERSYYSHLIRRRKPTINCFEYVLQDASLEALETLFIDDTFENIESAQSLGIRTIYLTGGHDVISSLKSYLSL
ncbi:MAG: HAD family phosphatase [Saprospiraceae bacterium]